MSLRSSRYAGGLADAELFREMPEAVRAALARQGRVVSVAKDSVVFVPGDPPALHVVVRGRIAILMRTAAGETIELFDRHAGEVFGEVSLLVGRQVFEAGAATRAQVVRFAADSVHAALRASQPASLALAQLLAKRVAILAEQLSEVAFQRVTERVRSLLERLATEGGVANSRGYLIRDPLTHEELAHMVGAGRAAVTRALGQLQREGTIVRAGRRIIVRPRGPAHGAGT